MATVAERVTCRRCGNVDSGTFCSECGARLVPGNPFVEAVRSFTRPLWDYLALVKDVARTRDLVEKIRTERIDLQQFIEFSLTGAAVCGIIGALLPANRIFEESAPIVGDVAFCLAMMLLGVLYNAALHFFLRKKNRAVSFLQSVILIATIFSVALPAMQLSGPIKDDADPNIFQTIVGIGLLFVIVRGDKLLYEVRYRDVLAANAKSFLLVLAAVMLVYGLSLALGRS